MILFYIFSLSDMDEIFDENSDDLTIARHDVQLIETTRYKDGFREGVESSEQDAFEDGFIRGYSLISALVYDFYWEKERVILQDPNNTLLNKDLQQFENDLQSTVVQLKIADETTESQQIETIKRLRMQLDELLLKIKLPSLSIKST